VTEVVPDTKDWTWVLERPCPECGLDAASVEPGAVAQRLRAAVDAWSQVLARPDVRVRPAAQVWSPLEYACHVRDVLRLYDERLRLMLEQDDPMLANWDQDETAARDAYGEQDPAAVVAQLQEAGQALVARPDGVHGADWDRPGRRSDGARFTVASFSQYVLHDVEHHLHDVAATPV